MLYYCPFLFAVCKCVLFSSGIKFSVPCSCIFSRRNTAQVSSLKPCKSLHCPESLLISREDHSSTFFMICTCTPIFFSLFPSPNFCFFWSDQLMVLHLYKCLMLSGQDCHMYLAFVLGNYPQSYAILPPFQTQHTW